MKRKTVFIIIMLLASTFLSAQTFSGWWTGGNFDINAHFSDDCSTFVNLSLELPCFYFKHNDSGLTLSVTPYHFDSFCEKNERIEKKNRIDTWLNARLGIDLLNSSYDFDLMPYVSANWNPIKDIKCYRAEAGLELTWFTDIVWGFDYPFRVKVLSAKTAYGIRRGVPYYTAGVSVDFAVIMYGVLESWLEEKKEERY